MLALEKQTLKWMQLTAFLNKNNFKKPSPNKLENWHDHQKIVIYIKMRIAVKTERITV